MKSIDFAHKLQTLCKRGHVELEMNFEAVETEEELIGEWVNDEDKPLAMSAIVLNSTIVFIGNGGRVLFLMPGDEIHMTATGNGNPTGFYVIKPGIPEDNFNHEDLLSFGMFTSVHPAKLRVGKR